MPAAPAEGALRERLLEQIDRSGPITYADFVEAALYDPAEGFYARPRAGPDGDFVTAPYVSRAFGLLLARQLGECWEVLGRPDRFPVVEAGAGDGTLALQIREAVEPVPALARALSYLAVERTPGARRALEERGIAAVDSLGAAGHGLKGCVVANELLDNLPFHVLRERGGRVVEVMIGSSGGRLAEVERPPTPEALSGLRSELEPGEERAVSPAVLAFARDVEWVLSRGYAFLFDYAPAAGAVVRGYRGHRLMAGVLEEPGRGDVTAGVDFAAIATEARAAGLTVWGPVSHRDAFLALGLREFLEALRRRQADAQQAGDWRGALRLYGERSRASILADPDHLGSFSVMALGAGDVPAPAIARVTDDPSPGTI
jgi:SAM-dependent MidA family methyltransferase